MSYDDFAVSHVLVLAYSWRFQIVGSCLISTSPLYMTHAASCISFGEHFGTRLVLDNRDAHMLLINN